MELSGELFSSTFRLLAALLYAAILLLAVRLAYWRLLLDRELLHVFLGSCVILIMLWHIRAQIDPTWSFHLLGVTAVTLMFGWSFAVLAGAISEFAVSVNGLENWEGFALNAFLLTLVPATLTQMILVLVRGLLPKNFLFSCCSMPSSQPGWWQWSVDFWLLDFCCIPVPTIGNICGRTWFPFFH